MQARVPSAKVAAKPSFAIVTDIWPILFTSRSTVCGVAPVITRVALTVYFLPSKSVTFPLTLLSPRRRFIEPTLSETAPEIRPSASTTTPR